MVEGPLRKPPELPGSLLSSLFCDYQFIASPSNVNEFADFDGEFRVSSARIFLQTTQFNIVYPKTHQLPTFDARRIGDLTFFYSVVSENHWAPTLTGVIHKTCLIKDGRAGRNTVTSDITRHQI